MSVQVLETIKQQITLLTDQEQALLIEYLLRRSVSARPQNGQNENVRPPVLDKRSLRMAWLKANREMYAGMYVALDGDHLLGTGKNFPEAAEIARDAGVKDAYVDYVYPPNYEGSMGGW